MPERGLPSIISAIVRTIRHCQQVRELSSSSDQVSSPSVSNSDLLHFLHLVPGKGFFATRKRLEEVDSSHQVLHGASSLLSSAGIGAAFDGEEVRSLDSEMSGPRSRSLISGGWASDASGS